MARLHYLYEQAEGGKERFVYYCSRCRCILGIRRDLRPAYEAVGSLGGRCVGCGHALAYNTECRLSPVSDDWWDAHQASTVPAERRDPVFRLASSFPHFSLGLPDLDSLLRPLAPGTTVVISGAYSSAVAERITFRAQLSLEMGGLDSAVLFIDGGNRSDPYLFSSFAKQWGLRPKTAMRRVTTCRVFTMYQVADMISKHLVRALEDYATKLVVISDLLGTFNEPELDEQEARRLLSAMEEGVGRAKKDAMVLVTLGAPNKYDEAVLSWADTTLDLSESGGRIRAELSRHPRRPPGAVTLRLRHLLARATR
ncbi:MAG: hypothetical protein HY296_07820 [Thaumarchaeota archaeon]|nr:hypothetical protein [Nitrososphaerota archaeon]